MRVLPILVTFSRRRALDGETKTEPTSLAAGSSISDIYRAIPEASAFGSRKFPFTSGRDVQRVLWLHAICFSIALTSQSIAQETAIKKLEGYDLTFPAMGSSITLNAYSDSEAKVEQAFIAVRFEIDRLVTILSDYEPNSELNRLHREATTPKPISSELYEVLLASENWHARSNGAFDVAIGNLTRLWREARKRSEVPSKLDVAEAVRNSGWDKIQLNKSDRTLTLLHPKVRIDLGGIAAGYIVDRAFEVLLAHGLSHSLVNDGGDIRCGDAPPGRSGWRIEVASLWPLSSEKILSQQAKSSGELPSPPDKRESPLPLRRIYLKNAAITTSGDLWQYIEIDGQRRSHILDPKTGYGVVGPTLVTVIAPTCIEADAAATTVSVLGRERGLALVSEDASLEALVASRPSDTSPIDLSVTSGFPVNIIDDNDLPTR